MKKCDPSQISAFLDDIAANGHDLHGLVILQHGKPLAEGWWKPYQPDIRHQLFSLSKSFLSTAAGFAVTEGLINLDDFVISHFPRQTPKDANAHLRAMRVRHLLSMNTGHETEPAISDKRDWVKAFLETPPTKQPGTHFLYNSTASYMVSAIIQKVTGQTVRDYLMPRLFTPLGIPEPEWDSCPKGISAGGWGLWLTTGEIARFGQFLLQKGKWEGKQLLPATWIETATSIHSDNSAMSTPDWQQGYGFQFWRCQHGFYRGDGAFGQYCIVMESHDMVVAINSGVNDMQGVLNLVWKHLAPGLETPAVKVTSAMLTKRLASLSHEPPAIPGNAEEFAERFEKWTETRWLLNDNDIGLKEFSFGVSRKKPYLQTIDARGIHKLPFGWGEWVASATNFKPHNYGKRRKFQNRVSAGFTAEGALQLTVRFADTPDTMTLSFLRTRSGLELSFSFNVAFGPASFPILKAKKA